jgi:hypothetical protein
MSTARLRQIAPLIVKVGRKISSELGYQPSQKTRYRALDVPQPAPTPKIRKARAAASFT